jgi:hypothetical protein
MLPSFLSTAFMSTNYEASTLTPTTPLDLSQLPHDPSALDSSVAGKPRKTREADLEQPQLQEGYHVAQRSFLRSLIIVSVATLTMVVDVRLYYA